MLHAFQLEGTSSVRSALRSHALHCGIGKAKGQAFGPCKLCWRGNHWYWYSSSTPVRSLCFNTMSSATSITIRRSRHVCTVFQCEQSHLPPLHPILKWCTLMYANNTVPWIRADVESQAAMTACCREASKQRTHVCMVMTLLASPWHIGWLDLGTQSWTAMPPHMDGRLKEKGQQACLMVQLHLSRLPCMNA